MRVIGVIPARYASSRFPGKPLIDLKGKSMIQRVYEGVSASSKFNEVIVATDDKRIYDHVLEFGGKVKMTSPSHETGTDRCAEVVADLDCDLVINIQGDEPLVDIRQLEPLIDSFTDPRVHIATLAIAQNFSEEISDVNRIKVVTDIHSDALYFSRSVIPNSTRAKNTKLDFLRHIGVYAFRKNTLLELSALHPTELEQRESLEQLRWLFNGFKIRVIQTDIETPNIDVPEDLQKVLNLL